MESRAARSVASWCWLFGTTVVASWSLAGCHEPESSSILRVEGSLHLEEHLDHATIEGSELPPSLPEPVVWDFGQPQPDWQPVGYRQPDSRLPSVERLDDGLRLTLSDEPDPDGWQKIHGGLYVPLPDWDLDDWSYVVVRLRSKQPVHHLELGLNLTDDEEYAEESGPFEGWIPEVPTIDDGTAQDYILRLDRAWENKQLDTWRSLGIYAGADEPVSFDLLSIRVVPREADFAAQGIGVRMNQVDRDHRRVLYTHGSARVSYEVELATETQFNFGIGVLRETPSVLFRIVNAIDGSEPEVLFEESYADPKKWGMRSLDLSRFAGERAELSLEVETDIGTVALWAAPTLTTPPVARADSRPNVILYIIDGGGADYMSLFGYNRTNTPQLSRLAAAGTVFDRAYSTASWTKPSTTSFMTSIPNSALGGFMTETDRLPERATTITELLHGAGYQTAVIISNPYAGLLSGLQRGADFLIETGIEPNNSESSRLLHEAFWRWRQDHPGGPFWVHFQSTDIHEPFKPVPPFTGLYVDPDLRRDFERWDPKLYPSGGWRDPAAYEEHGIDQERYAFAQQGLYDEAMAHNDFRIGELVARLEERGEWQNTLLIVAADHGYPAACHRLMEPLAPTWGPLFNSHDTRVPLLFVWPDRIRAGQRIAQPVSMLDLLPTVAELLDLPIPETAQGRSLAPILLGSGDLQPAPVILDEFFVDEESGELRGLIEIVDGWWGASLEIGEGAANEVGNVGAKTDEKRPSPLLLYDLRNDPFTLHSLHEEHPKRVERFRRLLQKQWAMHQRLGEELGEGGQVAVGQEQLEALRALGYID